ncbi:hypothetical protein NUM3379_21220 [Kineococcus sp. NUM-3379]
MARVLVVEDDQDIRTLLEVRLRAAGHRVVGAGSGEEALSVLAERGAPEVLVSDVSMPGLSGLEMLAQIRADSAYAGMPVIFLSGRVQPEDIAAGQALGATYLTKPVVLSALCAAIQRALETRAAVAGSW